MFTPEAVSVVVAVVTVPLLPTRRVPIIGMFAWRALTRIIGRTLA